MPSADLMLRLLLAGGLGSVLGLERELRRSPAGLRTHILIALGAALFTLVSIEIAGGTPDHIPPEESDPVAINKLKRSGRA